MAITIQDLQVAVTFITAVAIVYLVAEFMGLKQKINDRLGLNNEALKLKLQAYERLTVFSERAGLKNLVGRSDAGGESAAALHSTMILELKNEYEYNASQQIYVTPEIWNAVTKLKDQNIYIINQLAAGLPPQATSLDLSKRILEYTMAQNTELNTIVLDALQFEAKKLLK